MIKATYVNHMGDDLTVVNSARVSFGKKRDALGYSQIEGQARIPVLHDRDIGLINYLATHKHTSPFGHCFASFHIKAPVFVARQLVKHKFLRWNEISRRYVDYEPEFYSPIDWRARSEDKKQGSGDTIDVDLQRDIGFYNKESSEYYEHLLQEGVAPEMARMVLPQSMYTEWYWSGS
jgi:thymidylate synthase (FAD)